MLKVDEEWMDAVEAQHEGFREIVHRWDAMELPACPLRNSADRAEVSTGLVGRSNHLAGGITKIRLLPNGHLVDYYCNQCEHYFDGLDWPHAESVGGTRAPYPNDDSAQSGRVGLAGECGHPF